MEGELLWHPGGFEKKARGVGGGFISGLAVTRVPSRAPFCLEDAFVSLLLRFTLHTLQPQLSKVRWRWGVGGWGLGWRVA